MWDIMGYLNTVGECPLFNCRLQIADCSKYITIVPFITFTVQSPYIPSIYRIPIQLNSIQSNSSQLYLLYSRRPSTGTHLLMTLRLLKNNSIKFPFFRSIMVRTRRANRPNHSLALHQHHKNKHYLPSKYNSLGALI